MTDSVKKLDMDAEHLSISDQLRAYNEKFPPSEEILNRARDQWSEPHSSRLSIAVSISDEDVARYLAIRARNDNLTFSIPTTEIA